MHRHVMAGVVLVVSALAVGLVTAQGVLKVPRAVASATIEKPGFPPLEIPLVEPQSPAKPTPDWVKLVDQGTINPQLKGYFLPEGLKVEIVAREPEVINPVGMTFADDGTLFVLEWRPAPPGVPHFPEYKETVKYKDGTTRQIATMKKQFKDKEGKTVVVYDVVKTLHDSKRNGVYDQAKVVMDDVELPSSILLYEGWLYLSGRGSVWRYKSSKGDGKYDVKEEIARGFCGFHHHQVSGLTIGNDGWLYITSGDDDNYVEGSDGSRATVLRTGAVFRCRPDGSQMQTFAIGFRNPYRDVAFDATYHMFHVDNDNEDGSKFTGCRLMHVPEEADFGWRLRFGARCCVPDQKRGAVYGELPGKMPPLLKTGRGAPAGLLIYNDTFMPERFRGLLLYPDVFRRLIRAYRVEPQGATFAVVEEFEFMKSDDELFRPCQMVVGPDGAIYVCDWRTNHGGAGQLWGDGRHGRIYRITWAGSDTEAAIPRRQLDSWKRIRDLPDEDLLAALDSANFTDRERAVREFARRGDKHRPRLLRVLSDVNSGTHLRIAAVGALQAMWNDEVRAAFIQLLEDSVVDLRRLAADGLALNCRNDGDAHDALVKRLADEDPGVRRAVALAIGRIAAPEAADALANAYKFDDGKDVYLEDGILRAIERLGAAGIKALLTIDTGADRERAKLVKAFSSFRSRAAAEALPELLKNKHLTDAETAVLLRSFKDYLLDPPISLAPVLDWYDRHPHAPATCKLAALEALSLAGALKGDRASAVLLKGLETESDAEVRLALIKAVEETRVPGAAAVLGKMLGNAKRSTAERAAILQAIRVLKDKSSVTPLKDILSKESAPLLLADALQALAAVDPDAAQPFAQQMLDRDDPLLQSAAIQVLGMTPDGAREVGERFLNKKLAKETLPQVSEALRKHAEQSSELAELLAQVMKTGLVVSLDEKEIARIRKLIAEKGDPAKGRSLFLESRRLQCINCHTLEGVGGNVGPDLTKLYETVSVEKLLESMIDPSKEIKEGYQTYLLLTTNGQTFRGLKVGQDEKEVVLRDAEGKEHRIPISEVKKLEPSAKSLMPDNVIAQISFDQLIDLVAFLKDSKAQESLRGLAVEFWVVGPFGPDLNAAYPPEAKPDPAMTYADANNAKVKWQPARAEPNGFLNLRAIFDKENASAYALVYVHSPKAQKVTMLAGSDDMIKIWINGKEIHQFSQPRSPRPDEDRVELEMKAGANMVLVKVVNQVGGHGLFLRFQGGEGLRMSLRE